MVSCNMCGGFYVHGPVQAFEEYVFKPAFIFYADVEMEDGPSFNAQNLKPAGGVGKKKLKKQLKKNKKRGKGKVSRKFKI